MSFKLNMGFDEPRDVECVDCPVEGPSLTRALTRMLQDFSVYKRQLHLTIHFLSLAGPIPKPFLRSHWRLGQAQIAASILTPSSPSADSQFTLPAALLAASNFAGQLSELAVHTCVLECSAFIRSCCRWKGFVKEEALNRFKRIFAIIFMF